MCSTKLNLNPALINSPIPTITLCFLSQETQETRVHPLKKGRSPEGGNGNSPQYSLLEKSHGQRRLVGYSPWGHKESDTT